MKLGRGLSCQWIRIGSHKDSDFMEVFFLDVAQVHAKFC